MDTLTGKMHLDNSGYTKHEDPQETTLDMKEPGHTTTTTNGQVTSSDVNGGYGDTNGLVSPTHKGVYVVRGWRVRTQWCWPLLTGVLVFIIVILICLLATQTSRSGGPTSTGLVGSGAKNICTSYRCLSHSAFMVSIMNQSVNPCADFYNYACGNFPNAYPMRPNSFKTDVFEVMKKNNELRVQQMLDEPVSGRNRNPSTFEYKIKTLYSTCLNQFENAKNGGRGMVNVINKLGGLDLFMNWTEAGWDFNAMLRHVRVDYWADALFVLYSKGDKKEAMRNDLEMLPAGTTIPFHNIYLHPERPLNARVLDAFKEYIRRTAELLVRDAEVYRKLEPAKPSNTTGTTDNTTVTTTTTTTPAPTTTNADELRQTFVDDVFNFETKLANLSLAEDFKIVSAPVEDDSPVIEPEPELRKVPLRRLAQIAPGIEWRALLETLMGANQVNDDLKVVIPEGDYVRLLSELIQKTEKRVLHHYLIWSVVRSLIFSMSYEYSHGALLFQDKLMFFQKETETRSDFCFRTVKSNMPEALGALFVKGFLGHPDFSNATGLGEEMRTAVADSLDWMTPQVRRKALSKLNETMMEFGFADWVMDDYQLNRYYDALVVDKTDFFQTSVNLHKYRRLRLKDQLEFGTNKNRWTQSAFSTHSYYLEDANEVLFPAGMLQPPFYSPRLPHYINMAALARIIAIRLADVVLKNSTNLGEEVWWDDTTFQKYEKYRGCIKSLYSNITLHSYFKTLKVSVPLNPEKFSKYLTVQHYGLKLVYKEYKRWAAAHPPEPHLISQPLDNIDQAFFLSYAQARCKMTRPDLIATFHRATGYVPNFLLINANVYNMDEFYTAFQCKKHPMSRGDQCSLQG